MFPVAILAGGMATRLGKISKDIPKSLIEIKENAFIDWQLKLLTEQGYEEFVICISHYADKIRQHIGDGKKYTASIKFSIDGALAAGTGGALRKALPILGDNFAVIYGDSFLPIDYSAVEEKFIDSKCDALMTVFKNDNAHDKSNVNFSNSKVLEYDKFNPKPAMHYIDYGLTYLNSTVFNSFVEPEPVDLSVLYSDLSKCGRLCGFEVYERFYEIGSVSGLKDFTEYLERNENELYSDSLRRDN
jgi:MurNAc alpha-1-phosphate uridylyltransferase